MAHRLGLGREALSQFERGVRMSMLQVDVPSAAGAAVVPVTSALMMMLIPAWLPPFETNAAGFKLLTI